MLKQKKTKTIYEKVTYLFLAKVFFAFFGNATYFLPPFIFLFAYSHIFKTSIVSFVSLARVIPCNALFLFLTYITDNSSCSVNMEQHCLSLPLITFPSNRLLLVSQFLMRGNSLDLIVEYRRTLCSRH